MIESEANTYLGNLLGELDSLDGLLLEKGLLLDEGLGGGSSSLGTTRRQI